MNWMNVRLLVVAACAPSNCDNKVLPPVYPRPIMSLPNVLIIGSGD
jgi:hypothetical protein